MNLKVAAHQCPKCLTVIVSGHRHDYHPCPCGEIAIDGGRDYTRGAFKSFAPIGFQLECVGITQTDLQAEVVAEERAVYFNHYKHPNEKPRPVPPRKFTTIKTTQKVEPNKYRYTVNASGRFRRYPKKAANANISSNSRRNTKSA